MLAEATKGTPLDRIAVLLRAPQYGAHVAEAGELCHWEIVAKMSETIGATDINRLAEWSVGVQRGHVEIVRRASLALAAEEIKAAA